MNDGNEVKTVLLSQSGLCDCLSVKDGGNPQLDDGEVIGEGKNVLRHGICDGMGNALCDINFREYYLSPYFLKNLGMVIAVGLAYYSLHPDFLGIECGKDAAFNVLSDTDDDGIAVGKSALRKG